MKTLVAPLLCLVALSPLRAQEADDDRRILVGLAGVYVVVEDIEEGVERDGLRSDQVRTDVELRLRQAGIAVLTRDEYRLAPGSPYFYVAVTAAKNGMGLYGYSVVVELRETVSLARNPLLSKHARTWMATPFAGIVEANHISKLRDTIRDMTDEFINAYLSANPIRKKF